MYIHDLHLECCRHRASETDVEKLWHRRLLSGHVSPSISLDESNVLLSTSEEPLGLNMLHYVPRSWWDKDVANSVYIRKNLSRHLRCAGLGVELGAIMLDFRWMYVQALAGGILGIRHDFDILDKAMKERS